MRKDLANTVKKYKHEHALRKKRISVVSVLALIVAISTALSLMLPAVTMSTICGFKDHTHGPECFISVDIPAKRKLICSPEYNDALILHYHDDYCYDTDGTLICSITEAAEHRHSDACYSDVRTLTCETGESSGHKHDDACYADRALICNMEEVIPHIHSSECKDGSCELEATISHQHTEACIQTTESAEESVLICQIPEHTHTPECYPDQGAVCGIKAHTHTDSCRGNDGILICKKPEHAHTDACKKPKGAVEDESYATDPYSRSESAEYVEGALSQVTITGDWVKDVLAAANSRLGCGELPKNSNSSAGIQLGSRSAECSCGAAEGGSHAEVCPLFKLKALKEGENYISITSNTTESGISVMIYGHESSFACPKEEIYVRLTQLKDVDDGIADAINEQIDEVSELMLFDITLFRGNEEIQPAGPVVLRFIGIENSNSQNAQTYHIKDRENADPVETVLEDNGVISVETEHFSLFAVALYNGSGINVGNHVDINDLDVSLNYRRIINNGNVVSPPPQIPDLYGDLQIQFNLEWAIDPVNFIVHSGDYFTVPIAQFTTDDANAYLSAYGLASKPLTWNGYTIGTGTLQYDSATGWMSYRVDFTWDSISNYIEINGSVTGEFRTHNLDSGSHNVLHGTGSGSYSWIQIPPPVIPSSGVHPGLNPNNPPTDSKEMVYTNPDGQIIDWRINIAELADDQFSGNIVFDDYLIVEDTLDPYQTFFSSASWLYGGIRLESEQRMYLVNADGTGFSGYSLGNGATVGMLRLSNRSYNASYGARYIDPDNYASEAEAEAYVRSHAKTFTVVHCIVNNETVEKLILNLGKPGDDGYKWSNLDFDHVLLQRSNVRLNDICDVLIQLRDECQDVVDANQNAALTDPIAYNGRTYTLGQWMEFVQIYQKSYEYYVQDPYIYNWRINISTLIKSDSASQTTPNVVNNAYIYGAPYSTHSLSAMASNIWQQSVSMTLGRNDVFIGKYDAITGQQHFSGQNMQVASPIRAAFEVYNSSGSPLTFTRSSLMENEYTYSSSGTVTQIWTARDGRLFLRNLPVGSYSLHEVAAASQYYLPNASVPVATFSVMNSANGTYVGVGNNMRRVILEKVDALDQSTVLAGAQFELYKLNPSTDRYEKMSGFSSLTVQNQTFTYYSRIGSDRITTNSNGKIDLRGLESGSYYLKEVQPPPGYVISPENETIYFTLSQDAQNDDLTVAIDGGPDYKKITVGNHIEPPKVSLTIEKDVTYGNTEESFRFEVTLEDANGNSVILPPGSHTPPGSDVSYVAASDGTISFSLKHGQIVIIEDIPAGTFATVKEINHSGYTTLVKEGDIQLSSSDEIANLEVNTDRAITYYNNRGAVLPETGGIGTGQFYALGAVLITGALMLGCKQRRRRERRAE